MYYKDQAIVLSRRDFRQDSLLINLYSKKHGKVSLLARGAKKIKSKMAGHVEPLNLVDIDWVAGKHYDQLTGAQTVTSFLAIKKDLEKVQTATFCIKYLDDLTRENLSDSKIFELTKSLLEHISENESSGHIIKISYILKLLSLLGLNPSNNSDNKHQIDFIIQNNISNILKKEKEVKKIEINNFLHDQF